MKVSLQGTSFLELLRTMPKKNKTQQQNDKFSRLEYYIEQTEQNTAINILRNFQTYLPNSGGGDLGAIADLTIQNINNVFYSIDNLLKNVCKDDVEITSSEDFYLSNKHLESNKPIYHEHELKHLFKEYGSDKSTSHNYFYIYDTILGKDREKNRTNT